MALCSKFFDPPVSPHLAARLAGVRIDRRRLLAAWRRHAAVHGRSIVVEGLRIGREAVLGAGVTTWFLLSKKAVEVPRVVDLSAEEAVATLQAAKLAYTLAAAGPGRIIVHDISPAFGGDVHLSSVEVQLQP